MSPLFSKVVYACHLTRVQRSPNGRSVWSGIRRKNERTKMRGKAGGIINYRCNLLWVRYRYRHGPWPVRSNTMRCITQLWPFACIVCFRVIISSVKSNQLMLCARHACGSHTYAVSVFVWASTRSHSSSPSNTVLNDRTRCFGVTCFHSTHMNLFDSHNSCHCRWPFAEKKNSKVVDNVLWMKTVARQSARTTFSVA